MSLTETDNKEPPTVQIVSLAQIRPPKYRLREDLGDLEELKDSLDHQGLIQPIVVNKSARPKYEIIAGHRRYVAALELGWKSIACSIVSLPDKDAFLMSLAENLQRKTMDLKEEAQAFHNYVTVFGWGSEQELAQKIHRSPTYVCERLRLYTLPNEIFTAVKNEKISPSHAEVLGHLDNAQAVELSDFVIKYGLTQQQTQVAATLMHNGYPCATAVEQVMEYPELPTPRKGNELPDPREDARCKIQLAVDKALMLIDNQLERMPDGKEKNEWILTVRYPMHELKSQVIKMRKRYRPRE